MAEQTAKHEWWQAVEHAIEHEGWKIVLLLRLTPLVPFNLLNYALACTAVRFWDYTWASSVGVLPGMVCTPDTRCPPSSSSTSCPRALSHADISCITKVVR